MNEETSVDCAAMIQDMLGLDPGMLGVMSPAANDGNERALLGFGMLVRRSFELGLQMRDRKSLTLRLKSTDEQARAWGYGDARSANIGMLLTWAAIRAYRHCRGFRYAPLMAADEKVVDLPPRLDAAISTMSNEELLDKSYEDKPHSKPACYDGTTPDDVKGASIWDLTRDLLGLYAADLACVFYDTHEDLVADLAGHPEQAAGQGLVWFLHGVAYQYRVMRERDVRKIQLRTDQDAIDADIPGGARTANLMTLMAASLFADKKHTLAFLAARERSDEENDLLRDIARWVYLNYNSAVFDGFSRLYEGNRHFGTRGRFDIATKLLHAVRLEVDPELKRMPVFVQAIEAGLAPWSQRTLYREAS